MMNKWEFHSGFVFAGKSYITWIKPTEFDSNGVMKFEHKTEESTYDEIREAENNSNTYFIQYRRPKKEESAK